MEVGSAEGDCGAVPYLNEEVGWGGENAVL